MRLILPQVFRNSEISKALNVEPREKRQMGHIATIKASPDNTLKAMALANFARFVIYSE